MQAVQQAAGLEPCVISKLSSSSTSHGSRCPADRERKVVEEWAAQLEDAYDALSRRRRSRTKTRGASCSATCRTGTRSADELLDAEPVLLRSPLEPRASVRARRDAARRRVRHARNADGRTSPRSPLGSPAARQGARLQRHDHPDARGLPGRQRRGLHCRARGAAAAACPCPSPIASSASATSIRRSRPNDILSSDVPSYFDRLAGRDRARSAGDVHVRGSTRITFDGVPEEVRGMRATPSLFRVLRVPPALGRRSPTPRVRSGAEQKVILSHGLWQRLYGGDHGSHRPDATARLDRPALHHRRRDAARVLGSSTSGYDGHSRRTGETSQFWIPLAFTPAQKSDAPRTRYGFFHIGRLAPGRDVEQVQAQVDALHARERQTVPAAPVGRARHVHRRHAVAGRADARDPAHAVSAVGRRRVRPADRRHQHRQPRARARQRPGRELATRVALGRRPDAICAAARRRGDGSRRARRARGRRAGRGDSAGARRRRDWTICRTRRRSASTRR